jgi:hypothetical protein
MNGVTRRAVLAGAATAGAAAATLTLSGSGRGMPALAIYDSRLPESRAFAAAARVRRMKLLDIASEDETLWRASRDIAAARGGAVIGMTGWTDWVAIRGLFEGHGLRVRHEARIASHRPGTATPFEWELA